MPEQSPFERGSSVVTYGPGRAGATDWVNGGSRARFQIRGPLIICAVAFFLGNPDATHNIHAILG